MINWGIYFDSRFRGNDGIGELSCMLNTIAAQKIKSRPNIGLVISEFNTEITELLYENAIERLKILNLLDKNITAVWVPGAVEIPLTAQTLAETENFDAIICLGAVIRGETSHYDYVCEQVSQGCQQVALNYKIPVIFGVLTTEDERQAFERVQKGSEAVDAALQMISVLEQIQFER